MTDNLADKIADLTSEQRAMLEDVRTAGQTFDAARDGYAKAIYRAKHEGKVSFGIMGEVTGRYKETIWRTMKRWQQRMRMEGVDMEKRY